ncbi:hypothetical protein [Tardiphaga robiniae]|uniref:Uncharacterized protein n=1 Tax=Tardiphaga robiniae TaxID=943830 RepID=A0A164A9J0_9BRAD|nr:hypothetical protein [Tardiphaga robiniae]KZD24463.1 hypothetical protein A4A58_21545 [Tardiphaga robiniae]
MNQNELLMRFAPLVGRTDIPDDVKSLISATVSEADPLRNDKWIYRTVVVILGVAVIATVFGGIYLAILAKADQSVKLPDAIVAIGSAAVGALAGLLAPSPKGD